MLKVWKTLPKEREKKQPMKANIVYSSIWSTLFVQSNILSRLRKPGISTYLQLKQSSFAKFMPYRPQDFGACAR